MAVNQTNFGKTLVVHDAYFAVDALENNGEAATQWSAASTIRTDTESLTSSNTAFNFVLGSLAKGKYAFSVSFTDPNVVADDIYLLNKVNMSEATKLIPLKPETFFPLDGASDWRIRINHLYVPSTATMTFVLKKL